MPDECGLHEGRRTSDCALHGSITAHILDSAAYLRTRRRARHARVRLTVDCQQRSLLGAVLLVSVPMQLEGSSARMLHDPHTSCAVALWELPTVAPRTSKETTGRAEVMAHCGRRAGDRGAILLASYISLFLARGYAQYPQVSMAHHNYDDGVDGVRTQRRRE